MLDGGMVCSPCQAQFPLSVVAVSGIPAAAAGTRDSCAPAKLSSLPEPPRPTVASILTFSWFCDTSYV